MSLHHDLLEQARHLANREPRRPRQASLRRSVSASCYALFHLLASDGAALMTRGAVPDLRAEVQRAFAHNEMKRICQFFALGGLPDPIRSLVVRPIEAELLRVAQAFIRLQEQRHAADYDTRFRLDRAATDNLVDAVESAFRNGSAIRTTPDAAVFLTALALHRQWGRG